METITATNARAHSTSPGNTAERFSTAKRLASVGEYEAARDSLAGLWTGVGQRPMLQGLSPNDQAELLLRAGALSGFLGSSGQIQGAQEFAKDLITESIRAFDALDDDEKVAEAQTDLAICYWREGALDEARVWFREALSRAAHPLNMLRALIGSTLVEFSANHFIEALALLDQAAPLADRVDDPAAHGCYHMQRAIVLKRLGGSENLDRALIENAAASVYFEQANHRRYFARVENNTGIIFRQLGRYDEALDHLGRALEAFEALGDIGTAAQVNETRARVFLAQQRYIDAEKIAFSAASALETGGEQSLLAEALETQGIALARLGRYQSACSTLLRASQIAETAGDIESSGRTMLTILEELKNFLAPNQIAEFYREADRRLGDNLSSETVSRLRAGARLAMANAAAPGMGSPTERRSFDEEVRKRESELIRGALAEANGSVTRAAKLLGLTHQGLCYIINFRHPDLIAARKPIRVRRKSIIKGHHNKKAR